MSVCLHVTHTHRGTGKSAVLFVYHVCPSWDGHTHRGTGRSAVLFFYHVCPGTHTHIEGQAGQPFFSSTMCVLGLNLGSACWQVLPCAFEIGSHSAIQVGLELTVAEASLELAAVLL